MTKAHFYVRDDGELMVEVRPGQFVNKATALRLGLVGASMLDDIERTLRKNGPPHKGAKSKRH